MKNKLEFCKIQLSELIDIYGVESKKVLEFSKIVDIYVLDEQKNSLKNILKCIITL